MITKNDMLDAFHFRHACKLFNSDKKIASSDFDFILKSAQLSPTSFGMQGIKLLVVTNDALKQSLQPLCWNQKQISTSSHLVIFTVRTSDLTPNSDWVKARFEERPISKEHKKAYLSAYNTFLSDKDIYEWGARQAYILLGNMMNTSAMLGIDSCAIEGFEKSRVEELLGKEDIALMCAFGYRVNEASTKIRVSIDEMCEFME